MATRREIESRRQEFYYSSHFHLLAICFGQMTKEVVPEPSSGTVFIDKTPVFPVRLLEVSLV